MNSKLRNTRVGQTGMTLLEIIIVMALLTGIIVAIFSFVGGQADQADIDITGNKQQKLQSQHLVWKRKNIGKKCPGNIRDLANGRKKDKDEQVTDSWGNEMKIECSAGKISIISGGPDEKFGTEDDIKTEF